MSSPRPGTKDFFFFFSQPTEEEASSKEDSTPSKPVVGIIYPPPEVRNIVDKTASFVARYPSRFRSFGL